MNEIVKICHKHGELTLDKTRKDGTQLRCTQCRSESNIKSYYAHQRKRIDETAKWREKNRKHYRDWARKDRAAKPEKYREQARKRRERVGSEIVLGEILRTHGLSKQQYEEMVLEQNNLCAICKKPEICAGRTQGKVKRLSIDHCHYCEELQEKHIVRGLLCHGCNTGIGKFNDDIKQLEAAIEYLKRHKHVG